MFQIVHQEPASLLEANRDLPPEVERVIRRALAKKPDQRFKSCGAFGDALERALSLPADPKSGDAGRSLMEVGALWLARLSIGNPRKPVPRKWQAESNGQPAIRRLPRRFWHRLTIRVLQPDSRLTHWRQN